MPYRNKKSLLSVIVIGYNNRKYLKTCFNSIRQQTLFKKGKIDVFYIDNISHDDSPAYVLKHHPFARVFQNHFNFGYAGGANQGIDLSGTPFVSIMNPDIILEPDFYERVIKSMQRRKSTGSATGKLLKYNFSTKKATKVIDTTGLHFRGSTRTTDRGQGRKDEGQYDYRREVWGVSGACPVYRMEALVSIKVNGRYFDEDFFMYKEDVDLSWRLNRKGWKSIYVPRAVGYHGRGTGAWKRKGIFGLIRGRKGLSRFQKFHSFRNHILMLIKNLRIWDIVKHPFAISYYVFMSSLNAIREGVFFAAMKDVAKLTPKILNKRKASR